MQAQQILILLPATTGTTTPFHHQCSSHQQQFQQTGESIASLPGLGAGMLEALGHSPNLMSGFDIFSIRLTGATKPAGALHSRLTRAIYPARAQ